MGTEEEFDPYHKWLGIPKSEQPPTHYRLLGVGAFEPDGETIRLAADRQMAFVRTFQQGPRSTESQRVLNELANACRCLLDEKKRVAYDEELRDHLARGSRKGSPSLASVTGDSKIHGRGKSGVRRPAPPDAESPAADTTPSPGDLSWSPEVSDPIGVPFRRVAPGRVPGRPGASTNQGSRIVLSLAIGGLLAGLLLIGVLLWIVMKESKPTTDILSPQPDQGTTTAPEPDEAPSPTSPDDDAAKEKTAPPVPVTSSTTTDATPTTPLPPAVGETKKEGSVLPPPKEEKKTPPPPPPPPVEKSPFEPVPPTTGSTSGAPAEENPFKNLGPPEK